MRKEPTHLGDGAYASFEGFDQIILTANHHDPAQATDRVYLDDRAILALCEWYFGREAWHTMIQAANL